jgi:YbgC/YbaW family acyl-CoA thioester hydrolase
MRGGERLTYSKLQLTAESSKGHVSNVKLFDYLDQARKEWYHYCTLYDVEAVVVHIDVDYKIEVFHNEKLFIRTWIDRVGNTSFTIKQAMMNDRDEFVVSAAVILTTINRQTRKKITVPNGIRSLLVNDSMLNVKVK